MNNEIEYSVKQAWELTAYIRKVAMSLYSEDTTLLNEYAMSLLGIHDLMNKELEDAMKGFRDNKESK